MLGPRESSMRRSNFFRGVDSGSYLASFEETVQCPDDSGSPPLVAMTGPSACMPRTVAPPQVPLSFATSDTALFFEKFSCGRLRLSYVFRSIIDRDEA